MRSSRIAAALLAGGLVLTATTAPMTATAVPPKKCAVPVATWKFDHDQTGGWWAVTVDMTCNWKYTKEYILSVYNRRTHKSYYFDADPTTDSSYHRVITIPSTPPSARESACVDASATIYGPDTDPLDSQRLRDCFPLSSPA
ncbi:hypothetical protein EV643_12840 [Kribbella sp. VKM Ac-2527]|uniref:Secreted protein n=1 Tax=Kribbella caucasensis TaxID=2512215 RepID=A0A4R6JI77_9ACTN|nr:hypothetical protein [Kribbella sp. VKM Ac-2527]TDO34255.1 hypothetical protein EV643_12840 [Kribbella sp. VKM Ac-2527]